MNTPRIAVRALVAIVLSLGAQLMAQPPAPTPSPVYGKAADNKIFAQTLVTQLVAANPIVFSVGIHAIPPGKKVYQIVAQTRDLLGKISSQDDLDVMTNDMETVTPIAKGARYAFVAPLRDQTGKIIGLVSIAFNRGPGVSPLTVFTLATPMMEWLTQQIPTADVLFKPLS